MRPIRLTLNAFGPYAGQEVVDFTAALDAGIFGIYGDTGSGKTTIFDGIAFALFGQSSGAERVSEDMISQYANPKEITYVELVFDLGEKRYVVRRIPRQERASNRGEGTTSQAHEVYLFDATGLTLSQISGDHLGEMMAEKKTSLVDPMIKDLLGYDAVQFRQIVLLPQGEFRKILTASSDERSPILKRLFDVSLYEGFMQKIRTQAAEMRQKIKDQRLVRKTILDPFTDEELAEDVASGKKEISALEGRLDTLASEDKAHQSALKASEVLSENFTSLEEAQDEKDTLNSQSETIGGYVSRVANARAAQSVLPAETLRDRALQEVVESTAHKSTAESIYGETQRAYEVAKEALQREEKSQPERDVAAKEVQTLAGWKVIVEKSTELQQPVDKAKQEFDAAVKVEADSTVFAEAARAKLLALQTLQKAQPEHAQALSDATAELDKLEKEAETARQYEASLLRRDEQASIVEVHRNSHNEALENLSDCNSAYKLAEQDLTDIQALHVARKLTSGEACPACGSLEHPNPATGDPERLGRHDSFDAAEKALGKALEAERDAKGFLATANARLTDRQLELDELTKPARSREEMGPMLTAAQNAIEKLARDARFNDLRERLDRAEKAFGYAEDTHKDASLKLTQKQESLSNAQTALRTTLSEVPEEWRDLAELDVAVLAANAEKDRLSQIYKSTSEDEKGAALKLASAKEAQRNAISNLGKAQKASLEAEETFTRDLQKSNLSAEVFGVAKSDVAQLGKLENAIQTHNNKLAANKDRLTRLTLEIGEQERPDIAALQAAAKVCSDQLEEGRTSHARLITILEAKNEKLRKSAKLAKAIQTLEKEFEPLGEIANLVNGDNDLKVRLPDFAIAAMFDEVLDAANLRLGPMTNQRYQLHRPVETTGGRSKRGLDIAVFDQNTGKSRSTTSLSGGEGFQASLALALGLSDVVQQNSGGIKLDAIFIDEGFGTLDEDTLNIALETLCSLTSEMRAVGLISHTEQVKSLITEGFDVKVTPGGSHIHPRNSAA